MSSKTTTLKVESHCMKCRAKRDMDNPEQKIMKNGRPFIKGTCNVCGTKMTRIGQLGQ